MIAPTLQRPDALLATAPHRELPLTLVQVLLRHSIERPDATAYVFIREDGREERLTFAELARRARAVAKELSALTSPGDRAVLVYQPSLDFIEAILGCFFARVVAVPVVPLRNARELPRLSGIIVDSGARVILSNGATRALADAALSATPLPGEPTWLCTDGVSSAAAEDYSLEPPEPDSLAFLQYTSGSTGNPKGVMVSHANLIHNQGVIQAACQHDDTTVFAGWLPFYHDMGLIGNVFQPLYLGIQSVLFSPMTFLVSPATWLRTISRFRATTSGGPSFAYELCVQRVTAEDLEGVDLSSWRVAFNGAEPVKAQVIQAFIQKFSAHGFRAEAFYPCYGLAESTLFVTGGLPSAKVVTLELDADELGRNRALEQPNSSIVLVSCGKPNQGQSIRIVDPDTLRVLPDGQVGEIWQAGGSVAQGYWGKPELTTATFDAYTSDNDGPFLRTGDLGFSKDGELYISGRLKDLIIIRGRNYYPNDIESAVCENRPALRAGAAAAFTVQAGGDDKLVVVAEVQRAFLHRAEARAIQALVAEVRAHISDQFGLRLWQLVLIQPGRMPKTSSGKVRRRYCRELLQKDELLRVEARTPEADELPVAGRRVAR